MKKLIIIVFMALVGSGAYGAVGDVHSAQAEFSSTNNPNGNWSYHVGQAFAGFPYDTLSVTGSPGDGMWEAPAGGPYSRIGGGGSPADEPGHVVVALPFGGHSPFMARWTVPAGVAAVEAHLSYCQLYEPTRQMRLHLMKNGFEIAAMDSIQPLDNSGSSYTWTQFSGQESGSGAIMIVNPGDTIDFVVDAHGTDSESPGTGCSSVFTAWIKEINEPPTYDLTVLANPGNITTVTHLGTTTRHVPGFPTAIEAFPMADCQNSIKYVFDHWEINSNAQIADLNDPSTTFTLLSPANAQITAHYTTAQFISADCDPWDLWFDGKDDYVDVTDYKGITGTSSRTVSAWIRTTKAPGEIITWGDNSPGAKWIVRVNETGALRAEVSGGYIYGTTAISNNRCHHVAVVLDSDGTPDISEVLLYVDGQLETISGVADEPIDTASTQNVTIGVFTIASGRYFEGFISDVRIYDRALSEPEIYQLTNDTEVTTGLVAHWPLDEFSSNTANDAAGNNDGTIKGRLIRAQGMFCAFIEPTTLGGDTNRDNIIDLTDVIRLTEDWLRTDCEVPYYCMGADIDEDQSVNMKDYASLSKNLQNYMGSLRHMGYVLVSPFGPGDGGDYGPFTPGTQTSGWQEAIDFALANDKDVYIIGGGMPEVFQPPVMHTFSTTLQIPPAENFRITGGYYLFGNSSGGNIIEIDSQKNSVFELGMMGSAFTDNSKACIVMKPTLPRPDGQIAITNSKLDMSFQIGNGDAFGGTVNIGTGTILDATHGPIEHNFIRVMEINACKNGVIFEAGEINHNIIHTPFTHLTHNPFVIKSGKYNSIFTLADPSSLEPGIGVDIQGGEENFVDAIYGGGAFDLGNYLVIGQNASNTLVYARGLPTNGLTNNNTSGMDSTNKVVTLNPAGFTYLQTPAITGSGQIIQNRSCFTVAAIITSPGNVASWWFYDNNSNFQIFNAGLRAGQEIYLEPGEKVAFFYSGAPGWTWKAMVRQ